MANKSRECLKDKKRIVVKVGSSSLVHEATGEIDFVKVERLVRLLCDLRNQGKDVILVTSGAIGVGRKVLGLTTRPDNLPLKQACASVGQSALMMFYQKLFNEYNQVISQILVTKNTIILEKSLFNAKNTFNKLLELGVIPIVNENDSVSTEEIEIGDNDTLSAIVASITGADLLVLLSDIDGLYTDDPNKNPLAGFIDCVPVINEELYQMAKGSASDLGTGGMVTKIDAARIATDSGSDMVIVNSKDFRILNDVMEGKNVGTLFLAHKNQDFDVIEFLKNRKK